MVFVLSFQNGTRTGKGAGGIGRERGRARLAKPWRACADPGLGSGCIQSMASRPRHDGVLQRDARDVAQACIQPYPYLPSVPLSFLLTAVDDEHRR